MQGRILQVGVILGILALWEGLPQSGVINPNFLTPLSDVVATLWQLVVSGQLAQHAAISLQRIAYGLGVSILIGVPLGLGMGWWRTLEQAFDGPLQAGRQISAFALFPVFILFFGIGEVSKVVIVFWASVWPIILNTTAGVKGVDAVLVRAARSMNANGWTLLRKVVIPAAAPSIFTGIRLGGAYAFMVLVAAEMIGANAGLGFLVLNSQEVFRIPQMYAAIVALVIFGLALNRLLLGIERSATSWRQEAGA
ncbi:ABC transporter permease [Rhodovastum atsumiense]|uniref:ABC transporter permease n=1 Tax=Rhodovastum atsumiense TaxID=504468 RepID=A0A5M6IL30_9PROT|nr:ABC transporter permease [Rhodovastum atsumiense]KAA5608569.1 ABC transporter permease [Rhodovastum atsumiense]CAH2598791.1 ABC transporter permease [Rhodovastum atsumiense]